MSEDTIHQAVLVEDTMRLLNVKPGGRYIDGTLGGATHTLEILHRSSPGGRVLSLDVDPQALKRARERLAEFGSRWLGIQGNFRHLDEWAERQGLGKADGVLLDLGFSSDQLVDAQRGLSFQHDGPLDMRLGLQANADGLTAQEIVNTWSQERLANIIREYGEERFAWRIAMAIVKSRTAERINGVFDLVSVIRGAVPAGYERGRIHPATRTFQALRIAVNDELAALQDAIEAAHRSIAPDGRCVIISFHSLEDRIVKRAFRDHARWEPLTKRPVTAGPEETALNPRARSTKLRGARKK